MYRVFTCMRGVEIVGRSNANQLEEKRRVSLGQTSTEDPEGCTLGDCHIKLQRCWGFTLIKERIIALVLI